MFHLQLKTFPGVMSVATQKLGLTGSAVYWIQADKKTDY